MTDGWWLVLLLGIVCVGLRAIGPVALGGRRLPGRFTSALDAVIPALLAAFVTTQTLTTGRQVVLDPRAVGVVAALVVAIWRRSPVMVLLTAAGATAAARALGA
jgi:branched-subunit amino acid transport protein